MEPGKVVIPLPGQRAQNHADYRRFKLFQLSILWRAHMASHRLFSTVDVGPRHAERLRMMFDAEEPGTPAEYPCVLAAMYMGAGHVRDLILGVIQWLFDARSRIEEFDLEHYYANGDAAEAQARRFAKSLSRSATRSKFFK